MPRERNPEGGERAGELAFMTRCESYLGHALELPTLPGKSGKSLTPSASSSANRLSAGNLAGMK